MRAGDFVFKSYMGLDTYFANRKASNLPKPAVKILFIKGDKIVVESQETESVTVQNKQEFSKHEKVLAGSVQVYRNERGEKVAALFPVGHQGPPEVDQSFRFVTLRSKLENDQIDFFTEHVIE